MVTDTEPPWPIGSGYGAPDNEFTIWQIDPVVAMGSPLAAAFVCVITEMTPVSGGPAAPGDNSTAHPTETGGPGIFSTSSRRTELRDTSERDLTAFHFCLPCSLERRGARALERQIRSGL